jgi:hypothetical protein
MTKKTGTLKKSVHNTLGRRQDSDLLGFDQRSKGLIKLNWHYTLRFFHRSSIGGRVHFALQMAEEVGSVAADCLCYDT